MLTATIPDEQMAKIDKAIKNGTLKIRMIDDEKNIEEIQAEEETKSAKI